ncbi:MAG TPA: MMPL family transporter, partial [Candidatus Dormibacteraeota bacterium]|nr:MMPL family transporter [Candidatus Dormibacteraeota bacterium]
NRSMRRWGLLIHRHRWVVLLLSVTLFVISIAGSLTGGQPKNASNYNVESVKAARLESQQLPSTVGSSFGLLFTSSSLTWSDPRFETAAENALAALRRDSRVTTLKTPYDSSALAHKLVSSDKHSIAAMVGVKSDFSTARQQFGQFRAEVNSPVLSVSTAGDVPLAYDFDHLLAKDLSRSEVISLPLALILLVIVFGKGVAALLCLGVGVFAVLGGLGATLTLAHTADVATYATNVVTLVGLGIAIDYSLFIVSRFREELARDGDVPRSLGATMATAGRAITFSGITVAIGLAGLLFYTGTPLVSMGYSGAIVVGASVLYALTFLPALLAILGPRVNRLRVPVLQQRTDGHGLWHRWANWVMRRPWFVLVPTAGVLIAAGTPFYSITLANSDVQQLPVTAESRVGAELLQRQFPETGQNTLDVVVQFSSGSPTDAANVARAYSLSRHLATLAGVVSVRSYVDGSPPLTLQAYQSLYQQPAATLPEAARTVVHELTGRNIAVIQLSTPFLTTSDQAHTLVRSIRGSDGVAGASVQVTGNSAFDIDFVDYMLQHTPAAIAFVVVTTFLVLLLLLRSLVLPLKAVLMNALSLSAAFGALVWVFEQGHLSSVLGFTPGALDPTIPVLLFCIVFGLSMDYEVFLLTRMQESYRISGDNRAAVATGLERSGRLVTGAAAIMACVFLAFALASVVTIKAIGLGMAVAVIVDATLVRAFVVPALMRLLGRVNWWAPRWLRRPLSAEESAEAA